MKEAEVLKDHRTKPEDRIPFAQLAAYGAGGIIPIALFNVALKLSVTYPATEDDELGDDGPDDPQPHNIFYLEGVFVRLDS